MTPRVPSLPIKSLVKSYPAEDLCGRLFVVIIFPSAITTRRPTTLSFIVPYLCARVPEQLVPHIPPIKACIPGSGGKNSPSFLRSSANSIQDTPASTTQSWSALLILTSLSLSDKSKTTIFLLGFEAAEGRVWPSNDDLPPTGTTMIWFELQIPKTFATSDSEAGYKIREASVSDA